MPSNVNKELKLLPRRDDPAVDTQQRDDGSVYLKVVNGVPKLFLNTANGGVQEIAANAAGTGTVSSAVGSGTNNALAVWSGSGGDTLDERPEVLVDGSTISSTIPLALGSNPASTGQIRLSNTDVISANTSGGSATDLLQLSGSNIIVLGDSSVSQELTTLSTINIRVASVTRAQFNAAGLSILQNDLQFTDAATAPHVYQNTKLASGTGDTFTINAQDSAVAGATNVGGSMLIRAGDASSATSNTGGDLDLRPGNGSTAEGTLNLQDGDGTDRLTVQNGGNVAITAAGQADISGASSSVRIGNNSELLIITGQNLSFHQTAVTNPVIRQKDNTTGSATGDNFTIHAQDCTGATSTGGALILRPGSGTSTNGSLIMQDGGGTARITAASTGNVSIVPASLFNVVVGGVAELQVQASRWSFSFTSTNPVIEQNADATTSTTGDSLTLRSQGVTGTGTCVGGALNLNGGDASGAGTSNTGGELLLRGGNSTNATANTGGALTLRSGDGSDNNGRVQISSGTTGGTGRVMLWYDESVSDQLELGGDGDGGFTRPNTVRIESNNVVTIATPSSVWSASATAISWVPSIVQFTSLVSSPTIRQDDDNTASLASGDTLTIHAQDTPGASGANTAGNLVLRAGDSLGAGLSDTGGDVDIRPGAGDTNGTLTLQDGGGTARVTVDDSNVNLRDNSGTIALRVSSSNFVDLFVDNFLFDDATLNPEIYQGDETGAGVSGDTLTIHAQNSTGTGTKSGGDLLLLGGDASGGTDTGGDATLQAGLGDTGGSVFINTGDGTPRVTVDDTLITLGHSFLYFDDALQSTCLISILGETTRDGYDLVVQAQETSLNSGTAGTTQILGGLATGSTAQGGDVHIIGGAGSGTNASGGHVYIDGGGFDGTGTKGNVAFHSTSATFASGEEIIFVGNATTAPTSDPTSGGFVYLEDGALKMRGSGGTRTTIADAGATGKDVDVVVRSVQTTTATIRTIHTISTADDIGYTVVATVNGISTGSTLGGGWLVVGAFKNVGGTLTEITGSEDKPGEAKDDADWDVTMTTSGTDILVQVQGDTGQTIEWVAEVKTIINA